MRAAWLVMAFLAIVVASHALRGILSPSARPSFMADLFARAPLLTLLHLAGGSMALIIGAFQVDRRIRNKYLPLHRRLGAGYIVSVVVGGIAALALATASFGGLVAHLGFGGLAVCWLATTLLALRSIRRRDILAHQRWIYRSYALTLAAVTLRIYLPLALVAGIQFDDAYRVISWMCWVPNLLIAETWFVHRASPHGIGA